MESRHRCGAVALLVPRSDGEARRSQVQIIFVTLWSANEFGMVDRE